MPDTRGSKMPAFSEGEANVSANWYESSFGKRYSHLYKARSVEQANQQVEFALSHCPLSAGSRVLDLCCGAGRHSLALSKSAKVTALDLSSDLLHEGLAGEANQAAAQISSIQWIRADMRALPLAQSFDALFSFFTSFGYFFSEDQNLQVVQEMSRVLKEDGVFLLDLMDREHVIQHLVSASSREVGDTNVEEERRISEDGLRVEKQTRVLTLANNGLEQQQTYHESVRMYRYEEMLAYFDQHGLSVQSCFSDFEGTPFEPGRGARMVFVGKKARA